MNAVVVKTSKKIKLSDAQRQSLRKLYKSHVSGEKLDYKWATDPTKMALYKLGLIDADVFDSAIRGKARIRYNTEKINAAGIALGQELFSMDWWSELIGAYISQQRRIEMQNNSLANHQAIEAKFNLVTEYDFKFSGKDGIYTAVIEYGTTKIEVKRPYISFYEDKKPYAVFITNRSMHMTAYSPEGVKGLAAALIEAAEICRKFQADGEV